MNLPTSNRHTEKSALARQNQLKVSYLGKRSSFRLTKKYSNYQKVTKESSVPHHRLGLRLAAAMNAALPRPPQPLRQTRGFLKVTSKNVHKPKLEYPRTPPLMVKAWCPTSIHPAPLSRKWEIILIRHKATKLVAATRTCQKAARKVKNNAAQSMMKWLEATEVMMPLLSRRAAVLTLMPPAPLRHIKRLETKCVRHIHRRVRALFPSKAMTVVTRPRRVRPRQFMQEQ